MWLKHLFWYPGIRVELLQIACIKEQSLEKVLFCRTILTGCLIQVLFDNNNKSGPQYEVIREKVYFIYIFRTAELTRMVIWPMNLSFIKLIHCKWFVKFIFCRLCLWKVMTKLVKSTLRCDQKSVLWYGPARGFSPERKRK